MNILILILCALSIVTSVPYVYAGEEQTTPFGAVCPACDTYGYCHKPLTYTQALHNLETYYSRKGLQVTVVRQFGRFLEANVYREGTLVERVILDRHTGRIRPIY
ncbi:MAG: hypothetical protein L6290_06470 [Thermodesulfovibrionales bacterium]|nr:hypothetical protein [Thermodesulfovibrionales bacterium]